MKNGIMLFLLLFSFNLMAGGIDLSTYRLSADKGEMIDLAKLNEGPLLIVNIATRCGLTGQLEDLEKLYQEYKERGLQIVAIPSNDFAGQTPEGDAEVAQFCRLNYGVSFPITTKQIVKGSERHPLYNELIALTKNQGDEIHWNFEKFLVAPKGAEVLRFKPRLKPMDKKLKAAIEGWLK